MKTYWEKLQDPRWQKKRLEILQRDGFRCRVCGDDKSTLNVHHQTYFKNKEPWEYEYHFLHTTCKKCHKDISLKVERIKEWAGDPHQVDDLYNFILASENPFLQGTMNCINRIIGHCLGKEDWESDYGFPVEVLIPPTELLSVLSEYVEKHIEKAQKSWEKALGMEDEP